MTEPLDPMDHRRTRPEGPPVAPAWPGLSGRLLILTVLFVMLAEVLIYVPSIANFRRNWLNDRIGAAQIAALVLDAAPAGAVPPELERKLVAQLGAVSVAMRAGGARRLLAVTDMPPNVGHNVDLRESSPLAWIMGAMETLFAEQPRYIRIVGPGMDGVEFVEIVLDEAPLREAMVRFSINILLLSLLISGITALLVYVALHRLIVKPVRRLTSSIMAFEQQPEDAGPVIKPSRRTDEIGMAEHALATMQKSLAEELRQKKHLAALGLAVSKINHDLRNMLASAQLFSDRLSGLSDPTVQRFAPKLIAALDRAIGFCQSTLAYGRAVERPPERRRVLLAPMVEDLRDLLGLWDDDRDRPRERHARRSVDRRRSRAVQPHPPQHRTQRAAGAARRRGARARKADHRIGASRGRRRGHRHRRHRPRRAAAHPRPAVRGLPRLDAAGRLGARPRHRRRTRPRPPRHHRPAPHA